LVQRLSKKKGFLVNDIFELVQNGQCDTLTLSWEGNPLDDIFADSILAVLMAAEIMPSSVKACGASKCAHSHDDNGKSNHHEAYQADPEKITKIMKEYLEGYYGPIDANSETLTFIFDGSHVIIELDSFTVKCDDEAKQQRISKDIKKFTSILNVDYII
jgi:cleavage and polyadenylation specificity factor subunit 3